jgi:two-component system OmpR family sensor kinase
VADTGSGIPPEEIDHIFERFYRVDVSRTRTSGGFGLGLAIVKELVTAMGGTVAVSSKVGEGSAFRVLLRVAEAGAGAPVPTPAAPRNSPAPSSGGTTPAIG